MRTAAAIPPDHASVGTNFVHHAIVHNLPEHGTVRVTTGLRDETAELTVESSGARLTPQLVATGVGLGLAIVQRITQAHDVRRPGPARLAAGDEDDELAGARARGL